MPQVKVKFVPTLNLKNLSPNWNLQDMKAKKLAEQRERQAEAKGRRERERAKAFKAPKDAKGRSSMQLTSTGLSRKFCPRAWTNPKISTTLGGNSIGFFPAQKMAPISAQKPSQSAYLKWIHA